MVLLNQLYNIIKRKKSKGKVLLLFLFLFSYNLYASSYFLNDFRDKKNKFYTSNQTDIKSDKLNIKVFDSKWELIPSYNKVNNFYGYANFDLYYTFDKLNFGILQRKSIDGNINDGFIQTWYQIGNNFSSLLTNESIGANIDYLDISGEINYAYTQGLYFEKIINKDIHYFSSKLNILYGRELQNLNFYGNNSNDKFLLSFDYYYSSSNRITKYNDNDNFTGYGLGLDFQYIYNKDKIYFYLGAFNVGAFIKWKSISKMHYDFDSEVIYEGDDGYNHYKPFGNGYYEYDISYTQRLMTYFKTNLDYKVINNYNLGILSNLYNDDLYNEVYSTIHINQYIFKLGYLIENKNMIFGTKYKEYQFEISNKFDSSEGTSFSANYKIEF